MIYIKATVAGHPVVLWVKIWSHRWYLCEDFCDSMIMKDEHPDLLIHGSDGWTRLRSCLLQAHQTSTKRQQFAPSKRSLRTSMNHMAPYYAYTYHHECWLNNASWCLRILLILAAVLDCEFRSFQASLIVHSPKSCWSEQQMRPSLTHARGQWSVRPLLPQDSTMVQIWLCLLNMDICSGQWFLLA